MYTSSLQQTHRYRLVPAGGDWGMSQWWVPHFLPIPSSLVSLSLGIHTELLITYSSDGLGNAHTTLHWARRGETKRETLRRRNAKSFEASRGHARKRTKRDSRKVRNVDRRRRGDYRPSDRQKIERVDKRSCASIGDYTGRLRSYIWFPSSLCFRPQLSGRLEDEIYKL